MTMNRRNDLVLSEALTRLVDEGALSEGSREYRIAQAVVRDGPEGLSDEERRIYDERVVPMFGGSFKP